MLLYASVFQQRSQRILASKYAADAYSIGAALRERPFTRPTIVAATDLLGKRLSQANFDLLLVRIGADNEVPLGATKSVAAKTALLAQTAIRFGTRLVETIDGEVVLAEAIVREAVASTIRGETADVEQMRFLRGLALNGYVVSWSDETREPVLRMSLPSVIDLPAGDDEVHKLLKQFSFATPLGHLDQAIDAHTRGDWAAANSQIRSFMESLLNEIAQKLRPADASGLSSENRRALLANIDFLSKDRNEWTQDGKNYLNGLFKMLHTDGSHPGLSNEDHSTFRLHVGLVTGRMLLRRLDV